jgi:hypothetical protein
MIGVTASSEVGAVDDGGGAAGVQYPGDPTFAADPGPQLADASPCALDDGATGGQQGDGQDLTGDTGPVVEDRSGADECAERAGQAELLVDEQAAGVAGRSSPHLRRCHLCRLPLRSGLYRAGPGAAGTVVAVSSVDPSPDAAPRRRWRPGAAALVASGVVLAPVVLAAGITQLGASRLLAAPAPHRAQRRAPLVQLHPPLLARTVRLSGAMAATPGRWGLSYPDGYVQVGPVVRTHGDGTVSRRVVHCFGAGPVPGRVRLERSAFPAAAALAAEVFDGLVVSRAPSPLGPLPLWHRPARHSDGADPVAFVGVHGRGMAPSEWLRSAELCDRHGLDWFSVSYRNDVGAPPAPDGRMHLGSRESDDLWAQLLAVRRAGFSRVVLGGISLGGALVANLLVRHGRLVGGRLVLELPDLSGVGGDGWLGVDADAGTLEVVGVVLEAPALDWPEIVGLVATGMRLPRLLAGPTVALARLRARLDPSALVPLVLLDRLLVGAPPLLVVHGAADQVVPVAVSDRLVAASSGAVYLRLAGVGHAQGYNRAHARYFSALDALLCAVRLT